MKNYVKLSAIKLTENEMKQITGGEGEGNQEQHRGPDPLVKYGIIIPMYGVPVPKE
ncbi:MAG: bacteriocin [Spirochaetales bacterium]|nr:bacteriocin [Spirochaetales bacterium]